MPDLVSELQLRFGIEAAQPTFTLEIDDRDAIRNAPINVEDVLVFGWSWTEEEFAAFYEGREILKVLSNGIQHVRLYGPPGIEVNVVATEPPVALKAVDQIRFNPNFQTANIVAAEFNQKLLTFKDVTKLPGVTVTQISPPTPAPPTVEYVGRKTDIVLDVIQFQNQRVAYQKYNYARGGFQTAYASTFVTNDGRTIDRPQWVPDLGGAFVLAEPATGAIVIRYLVEYDLYKVNYGMASGVEFPSVQLAWLRGDIKTFPMPPVKVLAIAPTAGRVAETEFEKVVYPNGATPSSWSLQGYEQTQQDTASLLTESARTVQTVRVYDPVDPTRYIDFEDTRAVTVVDKNGNPLTYRYNS